MYISKLSIQIHSVKSGEVMGLAPMPVRIPSHIYTSSQPNFPLPALAVGTQFLNQTSALTSPEVLLQVVGRTNLSQEPHSLFIPLLQAKTDLTSGLYQLQTARQGYALATITLSDQGAAGQRQDESCAIITSLITNTLPIIYWQNFILPDEPRQLAGLIMDLALNQGYDLIISTGGTGLSPRDTTPEAISHLLERRLPGFEQAMAQASLAKTPTAILSRAIAGTLGQALVLTLPGSKKAVAENLAAILPGLSHALAKLQGDTQDCGDLTQAKPSDNLTQANPSSRNPEFSTPNPMVKICYLGKAQEVYLAKEQGLSYATTKAVGLDLRAVLPQANLRHPEATGNPESANDAVYAEISILPGQRLSIATGISLEPESMDLAGFIYSRSGLGAIQGLTVAQGVGVIDPDYRGEIKVVILNTSNQTQTIKHGDRIAQLVFQPITRVQLATVTSLNPTERGAGGFGHTGKA